MSCVISYCSFLFFFKFFCVFLVGAIVCVYVCIQLYCSCCHYGVIKHNDDCILQFAYQLLFGNSELTDEKNAWPERV